MMTIASCIRTPTKKQTLQWTVLAGMTLVLGHAALAEDTVSVLMKQRLAEMTGKEATVQTVDYAPGAESIPHHHPGTVFAYVLEGSVVSQLEGEKPVTYTRGQGWYESPKKPHVVSKNASKTEPAKLLVFLLSQEGESLFVPMKSADRGR
jgi:quercetin dioxygenase-like cupin family protein